MMDENVVTNMQRMAGRDNIPALPRWIDDVPHCNEACPHHDGKRCGILGFRAPHICEPVVVEMGKSLTTIAKDKTEMTTARDAALREVDRLRFLFQNVHGCDVSWVAEGDRLRKEVEKLREALIEAEYVLALCTTRTFDAPEDAEVREIGLRIGFGALIQAASKEWAAHLSRNGEPSGGQHTGGPCEATIKGTLATIAAALKHE